MCIYNAQWQAVVWYRAVLSFLSESHHTRNVVTSLALTVYELHR